MGRSKVDWTRGRELINSRKYSDQEIADLLGCHKHTIKMERLKLGINNSKRLNYSVIDTLLFSGWNIDEVADWFGCKKNTILLRKRRLGMKRDYREYASGRDTIKYYPDIVNIIKKMICEDFNIEEDKFKSFINENKKEIEIWLRRNVHE